MESPLSHRQFTILAAVAMMALLFLAPVSAVSSNSSQQYSSVGRRLLGRLGSSRPSCISKCGGCEPCRAVYVPINPGFSMKSLETYPETWRCKCGDKLFMP